MINSRVSINQAVQEQQSQKPQKISKDFVLGMYNFVGLDYDKFFAALLELGKLDLLYKGWKPENPFQKNSYIIVECLFYYLAPTTTYTNYGKPLGFPTEVYRIPLAEKPTDLWDRTQFHYWLKWPNNLIVDLALQEFETVDKIPDFKAKSKSTKLFDKMPTMRAIKLAEILKIRDEDVP